jgi:RNA 2',3'-cyclic 3'-phosphodiesterase
MVLRLFIAVDLPDTVKDQLGKLCIGITGAKWVKRDQMHLTLRFIGEVDDAQAEAIKAALSGIRSAPFTMTLDGVGHFPPKGKPHVLWVGVTAPPQLTQLQRQIENALLSLNLPPEDHPFSPHITLARFRMPPPPEAMRQYLAHHTAFRTETIAVESFVLFSSQLAPQGAAYRHEAVYPLHE